MISQVTDDEVGTGVVGGLNFERFIRRKDEEDLLIYNIGTCFASFAVANPRELRERRFDVKFTYLFSPTRDRVRELNEEKELGYLGDLEFSNT